MVVGIVGQLNSTERAIDDLTGGGAQLASRREVLPLATCNGTARHTHYQTRHLDLQRKKPHLDQQRAKFRPRDKPLQQPPKLWAQEGD